jgi:hypothetical protein
MEEVSGCKRLTREGQKSKARGFILSDPEIVRSRCSLAQSGGKYFISFSLDRSAP